MEPAPLPRDETQPVRPAGPAPAPRPTAVVVTTTFPARPGDGTPGFVLTLARAIRDFDVTVVAPRAKGAPSHEVIDGVRVRRFAYFPARWEGLATDAIMPTLRAQPWRVVEAPFLLVGLLLATWREVRGQRAAVVNAHWLVPAGMVALVVRALTGVPYVVTIHGADAYTLRGRLASRIKRTVVSRAAGVAPVSADIARTLGLDGSAAVLRMGVDTAATAAAVGERHPEPGLVVCIGRLADKKGVDVLIDAAGQVPDVRVEIVGDGPARAALEARVRRVGVAERVRFAGRLPAEGVLDALRRAQVVAIPSKVGAGGDMEGTPVVLCEAMAAGVPVVASDLGGLGECLVDGKTGLLVRPGDAGSLAAALQRVVDGTVDLDALGRAAAEEAARSLDLGEVGRAYDRLLSEAAGLAGPPGRPTDDDAHAVGHRHGADPEGKDVERGRGGTAGR